MIELQFLETVPKWALQHGLNDNTFDLLEQIVLDPENKQEILGRVEYAEACCINMALEYAEDKGLL